MQNPPFLEHLRMRLREHGLPRRYVERALAELYDHFLQLKEQLLSDAQVPDEAADREAQERLIRDEQQLVDALISRRKAGVVGIARRHPRIVFLLSPIPLAIVLGLGFRVVGTALYTLVCRGFGVDFMNPLFIRIVDRTFYGFVNGATPLLALVFCMLAARSGRSIWFALASCGLLSLGGGMLKLDLVQCTAGQHVAYFQRYGPDVMRLALPMLVFVAHTAQRMLNQRRRERFATSA